MIFLIEYRRGEAPPSFQQKNFRIAHHVLHAFFSQPVPRDRGA